MNVRVDYAMLVLLICSSCLEGYAIDDTPSYNYSASIECHVDPLVPQYEGGIVANPTFDNGLENWKVFGNGKIDVRKSEKGNNFIVAYQRSKGNDSFSQSFYLEKNQFYTFSAWVQISEGNETVKAAYTSSTGERQVVGSVIAKYGCWSMIKGGLTVNSSSDAQLFFASKNSSFEIWVDSVSLQPFTKTQWRYHQNKSIEKVRKRKVKFHVTSQKGEELRGIEIFLKQRRPEFLIGCGSAETIISYKGYQKWFTKRFTATTFDNEMKWYYTEKKQGQENYTIPDSMVKFFRKHGISIRGHTILWDNPKYNPDWVRELPEREFKQEVLRHIGSVVSRYASDVIAWDVVNENLHFTFYEDRLGSNASAMIFKIVQSMDPKTTLFLNEYNTIEYPDDVKSSPSRYVEKVKEIRSFPGNENLALGIGLQGHFSKPIIPFVRACLDIFHEMKLPVWLTELDVTPGPKQAVYLEELMREAFSHPAVEGIIVWSGWKPTGCSAMCLTDNNFKNLPAGDVVDKLIAEWKTTNLKGITDNNGVYEHSLFHGEYLVTIENPETGVDITKQILVTKDIPDPLEVHIPI